MGLVRWLFAVAVGLGAALLFGVQPMAARALLPAFGGSAAVWALCLLFFQGALLLGYGWAHLSLRLLGERRQALAQVAVLALPLVWPVSGAVLGAEPSPDSPTLSLLLALGRGVGVMFVVLATTSPVLSRWYAAQAGRHAGGAYTLYAVSNAGSLGSLLAYPLLVEPRVDLGAQFALLQRGYVVYALVVVGCALTLWRRPAVATAPLADAPVPEVAAPAVEANEAVAAPSADATPAPAPLTAAPTWQRRLGWVGLAAVPSSLLSSLTVYLTTDIASLPLLWVLPLVLYLTSFLVIYRERPLLTVEQSARALPLPLLILSLMLVAQATDPVALLLLVGLAVVFLGATLAHGLLYDRRPAPERLTEFYLLSSLGGALGGGFNALVAPRLFNGLDELPLGLLAVAGLRGLATRPPTETTARGDVGRAALLVAVGGAALRLCEKLRGGARSAMLTVLFAGVVVVIFRDLRWPRRFALGLGALLLAGRVFQFGPYQPKFVGRSFFGTLAVQDAPDGARILRHGSTLHGIQRPHEAERVVPLGYYHPNGPLGDLVRAWREGGGEGRVGVVGLGAGAMGAYAHPGDDWVFYELDPLVERVATDPTLFTYLGDARERGARVAVVTGDARLQLPREADRAFGLLTLDAFSSDSIPLHLVTAEALALYARKTRPDGLIALHVSNRYIYLPPVLAATAATVGMTMRCREQRVAKELDRKHQSPSDWCVMLPPDSPVKLDPARWIVPAPGARPWTDGRASLLEAVRWRGLMP